MYIMEEKMKRLFAMAKDMCTPGYDVITLRPIKKQEAKGSFSLIKCDSGPW